LLQLNVTSLRISLDRDHDREIADTMPKRLITMERNAQSGPESSKNRLDATFQLPVRCSHLLGPPDPFAHRERLDRKRPPDLAQDLAAQRPRR
jgi:hypothetical protein